MIDISPQAIRALWARLGLGPARAIVPAAGGSRNACYFVDDELVVRFNTLDAHFRKFANERAAYDLLAGSGLPVPAVLALDESRAVVPYDFIVLTRLPGANLAESWRALAPEQLRGLEREAGACLARLHCHSFEAFGKLHALPKRPFETWPSYVDDYVRRYLAPARQLALVDAATQARLERALAAAQGLFAQVRRGALVHCDFHYENILQQGGRLSGLLDFEWAISGDPAYDLETARTREAMISGSEAAFQEGYRSVRALDEDHERRIAIYRLFFRLESAVMHAREGDPERSRRALLRMHEQLARVEALLA